MNDHESPPPDSQFILYQDKNGNTGVNVRFEGETVWLSQQQLSELYGTSRPNVTMHIKNIFSDGELRENSVCKKFLQTAADGKSYEVLFYNLDMIISLGYRINSKVATRFRQWATVRLREYIIKGFAMDDDRMKNLGGGGYWKELLERIRDIRASEKVFYRQILDIYATSIDYDPNADESVAFFKKVQNKIHYAVHGHTAAEVIYNRADAEKDFMGLMSFAGNRPHLADAVVAKNYLTSPELRALGQLVSGYLDFAERQAERHAPMTMRDWAKHLDRILTATGERLLPDAGSVSHEQAVKKAKSEYVKYQARTLSDVEKSYLASLKIIETSAKKNVRKGPP
ncbi:toxin Fic [Opitutaceae bacterium TAV5]|nr:toxin Fic [Opitutaceae bacterium TAV5]